MKNKKVVLASAVVAILLICIAVIFGITHVNTKGDKILKNVYIDNLLTEGMTKEEAKKELAQNCKKYQDSKVVLKVDKEKKSVSVKDAKIEFEIDQAVEQAYGVGRSKNLFSNFSQIMSLRKKEKEITLHTKISKENAQRLIAKYGKSFEKKAKNASLTRTKGKFVVIKAVIGQEVDYQKSVKYIQKAVAGWEKTNPEVEVNLEVKKTNPKHLEKELESVKDCLGSYTTSYASSSYNRRKNVENGASKISGTILYPGESFSVYGAVAPFNSQNGYYTAPSYASGKVVQTYGGGICQVSTTLYNAVLRAELSVKERSPHSMTVHYVPLSADAAIAGTEKDLKFTNNQKTPIYIEGLAGGGTLTFKIYGKETRPKNRKIEFVSKTVSVRNPSVVKIKDSTLLAGRQVVQQSGTTGYSAQLWKVTYIDGKEKERKRVNSSSYRSTPTTIRVGTKVATTAAPATTAVPNKTQPTTAKPSNTPANKPANTPTTAATTSKPATTTAAPTTAAQPKQ